MTLLANIVVEGAGFFLAGLFLCYLILWWKDRSARASQSLKAKSFLEQAKADAETVIRDARLAANEEALRIREQTEQSFATRRQEQADSERRLAERETLVNAQLEKVVQVEKNLQEQKDG